MKVGEFISKYGVYFSYCKDKNLCYSNKDRRVLAYLVLHSNNGSSVFAAFIFRIRGNKLVGMRGSWSLSRVSSVSFLYKLILDSKLERFANREAVEPILLLNDL